MKGFTQGILFGIGAIMIIFVLSIILAFPTMLIWNWLMPTIFGLIKITWLQALGLNVLCGILFKTNTTIGK